MKKALMLDDRKRDLRLWGSAENMTFSPDNKKLITMHKNTSEAGIRVISFSDDNVPSREFERILPTKSAWPKYPKFSNDSKKIIIGNDYDLLIYTIDDQGNISENPVQTISVVPDKEKLKYYEPSIEYTAIALSNDGEFIAVYAYNNLFLWRFTADGTIDSNSKKILLEIDHHDSGSHIYEGRIDDYIIKSPINFNNDGTISVIFQNTQNDEYILYIFETNGDIKSKIIIAEKLAHILFFHHDKKFAAIRRLTNDGLASLTVYDFNNENMIERTDIFDCSNTNEHIYTTPTSLIFNETTIAAVHHNSAEYNLILVDINNNEPVQIKFSRSAFVISPDNKKIVFDRFRENCLFCLLLTPEEEKTLETINELDITPLLHLDRILRKKESASTLRQYNLPQIIELLQKIGFNSVIEEKKDYSNSEPNQAKTDRSTPPTISNESAKIVAVWNTVKGRTSEGGSETSVPNTKRDTRTNNPDTEKSTHQGSENNAQEPASWPQFFADIYARAVSIIATVKSFFSKSVAWFSERFRS